MALKAHRLLQGPARVYVGAFGVAEPALTMPLAAPGVGWTEVGLTLGGTTLNIAQDYSALEADQIVDRAGSVLVSREISVETSMAQLDSDNLVIALNGGTVTPGAVGSADLWEPIYDEDAFQVDYRAVLLSGWAPRGDDGLRKKRYIIIRKVVSSEGVEISFSKEDQSTLGVTFLGHYVDEDTAPVRIITERDTDGDA